jgi:hypothetical protein
MRTVETDGTTLEPFGTQEPTEAAMSAPTHPRHHVTGRVDTRLPWWALALPVLAFALLLALLTGGGEARAAGGEPAVGRILERIQQTLSL